MDTFFHLPLTSVIAITNFLAIIFGIIFKDMLEYQVGEWQQYRESQPQIYYQKPLIILTYLLTCVFTMAFLASCLEVIGFTTPVALVTALIMVLSTAGLVWWQLGSLLELLVRGGSAALDIDSLGLEEIAEPKQ